VKLGGLARRTSFSAAELEAMDWPTVRWWWNCLALYAEAEANAAGTRN
jgi:hypothetical protein